MLASVAVELCEKTSITLEIGIYKLRLKCKMARESRTMKTANAAFSKSVICTSIGRNSTRQPIGEFAGGGLKRSVCQFVDCMFCAYVSGLVAIEPSPH